VSDRVVLKIGTSSLISGGRPDPLKIAALVDAIELLRAAGSQAVLVASGAIAVGNAGRSFDRQLAAAVGQGPLFDAFRRAFAERGLVAAQILLTPLDLTDPLHRDSACDVLVNSLAAGVVPVVNENDAVMVRNNDVLAALIAGAIGAQRLLILTDVPGLFESDPSRDSQARRIPEIAAMSTEVERLADAVTGGPGTGGMTAKLCAVWIATMAGVSVVIASLDYLRAPNTGTLIHPFVEKVTDLGLLWRALSEPPSAQVRCKPDAIAVVADGGTLSADLLDGPAQLVGGAVDVVVGSRIIARGLLRHPLQHNILLHHNDYVSFLEA
jgi:glutamate 5-kinase